MAVQGLVGGTKDYGISENPWVQKIFPWLAQVNNPLVTKAYAAEPDTLGASTSAIPPINGTSGSQPTTSFGDLTTQVNTGTLPPSTNVASGSGDSRLDQLSKMDRNPAEDSEYKALLDQMRESAASSRDSTLAAIQSRLNETRRLAGEKKDTAKSYLDEVLGFVNERYPELMKRSEARRGDAITDLGGQETKLQDLYARAAAQARRRSESAALQNRMSARANNRLGSSFYDQIVAGNKESLGSTLGASDRERLDKIAAIGTEKTRTNRYFDETANDLETQKTQAEKQAYDDYNAAVREAEALDRAGVLDFGEGLAQAESALSSKLDQIGATALNIKLQRDALNKSGDTADAAVKSFAYDPTYSSTIAKTAGLDATNSLTPSMMGTMSTTGSNPMNLTNLLALTQQKKKQYPYA